MKFKKIIIVIMMLLTVMMLFACNGGAYIYNLDNTTDKVNVQKIYILYPFGSYRLTSVNNKDYSYETGCYKIEKGLIVFSPKKQNPYNGEIKEGKIVIQNETFVKKK